MRGARLQEVTTMAETAPDRMKVTYATLAAFQAAEAKGEVKPG